jgi:nucleoside-triphosphatase THEP1
MIYIITGPIGSGKSSRLVEIYNNIGGGDGFYNQRMFENGACIGQNLTELKSGDSAPLTRIIGHVPLNWNEAYRYKNYSFSFDGFKFAEKIIEKALKTSLPVFIDEIGPLELRKKGLYNSFAKLLRSDKNIYAVIRDACLEKALAKFHISNYSLENTSFQGKILIRKS